MKRLRLSKIACYSLILLGMIGCGDNNKLPDPSPDVPGVTQNVKEYMFTKGYSWSAIAYHDVTLSEIHSEISDYTLSCTPPTGYSIYLKKQAQKDDAGFTVYRIVCDMDPITATTSNNENNKLEIAYTLTGTYVSNGKTEKKECKNSVTLQRFLVPDQVAVTKALSTFWYLEECDVYDNNNWVEFQSQDKFTEMESQVSKYGLNNTPLKKYWGVKELVVIDEYGNPIKKYQYEIKWGCNDSLPGWIKSSWFEAKTDLVNTCFSFDGYPEDFGSSVYLVTNDVMWTMKAVYSEDGQLKEIWHYKFRKYEAEKPGNN
ncbi:MAG: hypothetical protein K2H46_01460 [Muribaculaceae bacterium]|nr:hypothetical protein [Muribaculaceae bacterium]